MHQSIYVGRVAVAFAVPLAVVMIIVVLGGCLGGSDDNGGDNFSGFFFFEEANCRTFHTHSTL